MELNQITNEGGSGLLVNSTLHGNSYVEPVDKTQLRQHVEKVLLLHSKEEAKYDQIKETLELTKKRLQETQTELESLKSWKEEVRKFLAAPHQVPLYVGIGVDNSGTAPFQTNLIHTTPFILTEMNWVQCLIHKTLPRGTNNPLLRNQGVTTTLEDE